MAILTDKLNEDRVTLEIGGHRVAISESYEVSSSILEQPSNFTLRMGYNGSVKELIKSYPPGSEFKLFIGGTLQASGFTDGFQVNGDDGNSVDFVGRDWMRILQDTYCTSEKTLNGATYLSLVQFALDNTKYTDTHIITSAHSNRSIVTGTGNNAVISPSDINDTIVEAGVKKVLYNHIQTRLSENLLYFVRRYLDRAGLFLWAGANPRTFVLGSPNTMQNPLYQIERGSGTAPARRIVYKQLTQPPRYARCKIYGRASGKEGNRSRIFGEAVDQQMLDWGIDTEVCIRDANVANVDQAISKAYRKLAEGKRDQTELAYEVAGHSTKGLLPGQDRVIWSTDTMVHVIDSDLGIDGKYWIDRVVRRRSDHEGTTTQLYLRDPSVLIFGNELSE